MKNSQQPPLDESAMDGDSDWQMNSRAIGKYVLPAMRELRFRIPNLTAAILCTPDGFNVCSLGVDEAQVGQVAALAGSLLSVAGATLRAIDAGVRSTGDDGSADLLMIRRGGVHIIGIRVSHWAVGHLALVASAPDTVLGTMVVGVRQVASEIERLFQARRSEGKTDAG